MHPKFGAAIIKLVLLAPKQPPLIHARCTSSQGSIHLTFAHVCKAAYIVFINFLIASCGSSTKNDQDNANPN